MRNNSTAISGLVVMGVAREEIVGAARTPWGANVRDCRITPFGREGAPQGNRQFYTAGRVRAHQAVNAHITETYWQIGRDIVEFEQGGHVRAEYGKALLTNLSRDLSLRHGKGLSRSNVIYMRLLYLPDREELRRELELTLQEAAEGGDGP